MVLASQDLNTLKGYDIVLALSEEAINFQFRTLYNTPIPDSTPPPLPAELDNFKSPPEPRYYINHNLCIFPSRRQNAVPSDGGGPVSEQQNAWSKPLATSAPKAGTKKERGIRAHIECPQFRFHPQQNDTLVMSIKFKSEPWTEQLAALVGEDSNQRPEDGLSHSRLAYWHQDPDETNVDGSPKSEFRSVVIDGWKMEWEVILSVHEIGDLMDVVRASKDHSNPTMLHPETEKQIESKFKGVDSKNFSAASVFCLFEDTRISSSFRLLNEHNQKPSDQDHLAVALLVSKYYNDLHDRFGATPTTETPYVLGYGVSARPPALESILKVHEKDRKPTPKYFIPRRFDMTTTAAKTTEDQEYTGGTLNFCIQTFRDRESEQIQIEPNDSGAGHFDHPLLSTVKAHSTGLSSVHGVMAFSPAVFRDHWLYSLLRLLEFDPQPLAGNKFDFQWVDGSIFPGTHRYEPSAVKRTLWEKGHGWKSTYPFKWDGGVWNGAWRLGLFKNMHRTVTGNLTVVVSYISDLETSTSGLARKADAQHRTFIDFLFFNELECRSEAQKIPLKGPGGPTDEQAPAESWEEKLVIRLKARYRFSYQIVPADGGIWTITEAKDRSFHAQGNDFKESVKVLNDSASGTPNAEYRDFTLESDKFGTVISQIDNVTKDFPDSERGKYEAADPDSALGPGFCYNFMAFNSSRISRDYHTHDTVNKLIDVVKGFGPEKISAMKEQMDHNLRDLSSTVILPAGNVFLFNNVDTDPLGNLYTGMTYRPESDLERTH